MANELDALKQKISRMERDLIEKKRELEEATKMKADNEAMIRTLTNKKSELEKSEGTCKKMVEKLDRDITELVREMHEMVTSASKSATTSGHRY